MRTFKPLWLPVISALLLSGAACRDRDDRYESRKPVDVNVDKDRVEVRDPDGDFTRKRDSYTAELRARLARIDDRIAELRARGDETASETAESLRVRRDQLAERLDRAGEQTSTAWDSFKQDVGAAFDDVEREVDAAF
jgi:hypothetical protein